MESFLNTATSSTMIAQINLAKTFRGGERQSALLINALDITQKAFIRKGSPLKNYIHTDIKEISKPFLKALLPLKRAKLIHAHEAKAAQLAYLAHLLYGIPYIITRRVIFDIKQNPFTQAIYKNAAAIIAISSAVAQKVATQTKAKHIEIIPSAITPMQTTSKLKELKKRFSNFNVVHIGALKNSDKAQLEIIKAAKALPHIDFIFVGSGPDEDWLKSKASKNCHFEGFRKNIADYLVLADIFCFPSYTEGLGSILLDAMHFQKPIITRRVGGIVDIVDEDSAIFVNNPQDILQAIQTLQNNPSLAKKLASNGFKRSQNYHIQNLAPKVLALYQKVLG